MLGHSMVIEKEYKKGSWMVQLLERKKEYYLDYKLVLKLVLESEHLELWLELMRGYKKGKMWEPLMVQKKVDR